MKGLINNGGLNAGRKGMKRNKLLIVFLFCVITVATLGCIESQKLPNSNETATSSISAPEQKLPAYNETKPLKINDTFETWSRGYWSNYSYATYYFKIISNYSDWTIYLDNHRLDGQLFPGPHKAPKTIKSYDFNENFIIAAMMGIKGKYGPEIEIINISIIKNTVNVTVRKYEPTAGGAAMSSPYHIVIVKRELLPMGNSTFVFMDTEGKLLGKVDAKDGILAENATLIQEKIKRKLIGLEITYSGFAGNTLVYNVTENDIKMINETMIDSKRVWKVRIGEGISWDYYFDEKGENILKIEQLFKT